MLTAVIGFLDALGKPVQFNFCKFELCKVLFIEFVVIYGLIGDFDRFIGLGEVDGGWIVCSINDLLGPGWKATLVEEWLLAKVGMERKDYR